MAVLVKCSLCGRDVSSECSACPGCGHNVAQELRVKENELRAKEEEKKDMWEEQGLCRECGKNEFVEVEDSECNILYTLHRKKAKCAACGWVDNYNYKYHIVSVDSRYSGVKGPNCNYSEIEGEGIWWGLRKRKY